MSKTLNYEVMTVDDSTAKEIDRLCHEPEKDWEQLKGGSVIFDKEVHFMDKHFMVIQVVASNNPSEEPAWTQGILFNEQGRECGMTPPCQVFLGGYQVGNYHVTVEKEDAGVMNDNVV
jgi:hypothetical protein